MLIRLPWPPRELSPNSRPNRWEKARLVKHYRHTCGWEALAQGARPMDVEELPMTVTFCPPSRRRMDRDNMIASAKAAFDGLSDALGVDDARFIPTYRVGEPVKGGAVVVEVVG